MITIRKHWTTLMIITIVVCLGFSCTNVFAGEPTSIINELYKTTKTTPSGASEIISRYCDVVLSDNSTFVKNSFVYNAKRSSFVYLLCNNVGSASKSNFAGENYFVRDDFLELGIVDLFCTPGKSIAMSDDCDLSYVTSTILNGIMNDYINMKQPSLYGKITSSSEDYDAMVNDYLTGYFHISICNNDKHPYDKTCRMAKSYVKNVRNILAEVAIFNTGVLTSDPDISCATKNANLNIFYCGLNAGIKSMESFVNLLYNELFYYRLFVGYYMIVIQNYPELSPHFGIGDSYATVLKRFSSDYLWSKSALSLSLRMMRDAYVTFPLHVGLSMYLEDLDGFGKKIAAIAPPIYTLYDKLRNVQDAK